MKAALTLLILLMPLGLLPTLSESALAAGRETIQNPFADAVPPSQVLPAKELSTGLLPSFDRLAQDYVAAYYGGNSLERLRTSSRLRKQLFSHAGTPRYLAELSLIDHLSATAPEASYDLAKTLQFHWEALFGRKISQSQGDRKHVSMELSFSAVLIGMSVWRNPALTPGYFQLLRAILPLAGAAAGSWASDSVDHIGFFEKDIPLSPAQVMRLGVPTDPAQAQAYEGELLRNLPNLLKFEAVFGAYELGTGSSLAADAITPLRTLIRALVLADKAASPLKINPAVLAGSLLVGLVVEEGVQRGVDAYELAQLEKKYTQARTQLGQAIRAGDEFAVLASADTWVKSAVLLSAALNRPITEAVQEYALAVTQATTFYGEDTPRFHDKLSSLTRQLNTTALGALGKTATGVEPRAARVLREAAVFLKATGLEYLEENADYLTSLIARDALMNLVALTPIKTEINELGEGDLADLGASGSL